MGRGIALQFRKAFPDNYKAYRALCDAKKLQPGKMFVYELGTLHNPRFVINFPTKRHWKGKSRIEDIRAGLVALIREIRHRGIHSVAVPPLGCGLGGLDWRQVREEIEAAFAVVPDVQVLLFEPKGAPAAATMVKDRKAPRMTIGRAALLGLMRRYLRGVMDPTISLLEIHKLLYFMQEAGEDLKLRYQKGTYGPYAENLRHVLSHIKGYFISGYGDADDRPDKQIELDPTASMRAESFLKARPDTICRFDRVGDLISGFETPFGMELLATVHWVAMREGAPDADSAAEKAYAWNSRKGMFHRKHLQIGWETLRDKGWLEGASVI
jgi:O-acetyl-ADP-ribose deacetylase (regulator of RNase III)